MDEKLYILRLEELYDHLKHQYALAATTNIFSLEAHVLLVTLQSGAQGGTRDEK